jgi:outer membrane protein TolC
MSDLSLGDRMVVAWHRAMNATSRLKAANEELDAAEREHRLAHEAFDEAERQYYRSQQVVTGEAK